MSGSAESKTAVVYCRISRDAEGEEVGVRRQEAECRALAQRLGVTVTRVFTDNDTGASAQTRKSKKRPQYQEMLSLVRSGHVNMVLAYSNSRLTRRMLELEELVALAEEPTFLKIHTVVSGDTDLSTADGRMVARIKASVDAAESDRIAERSRAAYKHKALTGKPRKTGHRAFGWSEDRTTLDPFESELVRKGIHDLIRGVTLNEIRTRWEAEGIRTPSGGTRWHWTNTKQVLTRWRVAGVSTYCDEPQFNPDGSYVMGDWEPIVTIEEREQALAQIDKRKLTRTRQGWHLLSGLTMCECGRRMWGNYQPGGRYNTQYACSSSTRHVSIDASRLEKFVLLELYARLVNRERFDAPEEPAELPAPFPGEARLSVIRKKIGELMEAFNSDRMSGTVAIPAIQQLEDEAATLRKQQTAWLAVQNPPKRELTDAESISAFVRDFDAKSKEEKQAVLRQEIDAVVVRKGVRGGVQARSEEAFQQRVKIAWRE